MSFAFTPSPGTGLTSKLGTICFSWANTSSWGQFMAILDLISLPNTATSLSSRGLAWGE